MITLLLLCIAVLALLWYVVAFADKHCCGFQVPAPPLQDPPGFHCTHDLPVVEWERNGRCVCIHRREAADSELDPCHINRYLRIPKRVYIRHLAALNPQLLRFAGGAK